MNDTANIVKEVNELVVPSLINELPSVEQFLDRLVEQYQLDSRIYGTFTLSVLEAVNNALLYGNKENPEKLITIASWKDDQHVYVSVEDEGEGFDYEHLINPTLPENVANTSGRGLYLMKLLTDNLIFEKNGSKVILVYNL